MHFCATSSTPLDEALAMPADELAFWVDQAVTYHNALNTPPT